MVNETLIDNIRFLFMEAAPEKKKEVDEVIAGMRALFDNKDPTILGNFLVYYLVGMMKYGGYPVNDLLARIAEIYSILEDEHERKTIH